MYINSIYLSHLSIIRKRLLSWHLRKKSLMSSIAFSSKLQEISRANFLPLDALVEYRREEARRSIVVEVKKEDLKVVHSLCRKFGNIKNAFAFQPSKKKNLCIVEFEEASSLGDLLKAVRPGIGPELEDHSIVPFLQLEKKSLRPVADEAEPVFEEEVEEPSEEEMICHMLQDCGTVTEQMQYLYEKQRLTEVGSRLRFLVCRKVEWALPALLHRCSIRPFGSCINTFGSRRCDVDMCLELKPPQQVDTDLGLRVQPRTAATSMLNSDYGKMNLRLLGDLLALYMPGLEKMQAIFSATVPIIKVRDSLTQLDCDISIQEDSAFHMSELLHVLGCADARVRPLVFSVRRWARANGLTAREPHPWHWFSGFQLIALVLFYLMKARPTPVLPSLRLILDLSARGKGLSSPQGVSQFHVKDLSRLTPSQNRLSLEELFVGFFEFYKEFNFARHAISLVGGRTFNKPTYTSLYVQNPIERGLNVCKNVSHEELEIFQSRCEAAFNCLGASSSPRPRQSLNAEPWGLPAVCQNRAQEQNRRSGSFDAAALLQDVEVTSCNSMKKQSLDFPQQKKKKRRNLRKAPDYNF